MLRRVFAVGTCAVVAAGCGTSRAYNGRAAAPARAHAWERDDLVPVSQPFAAASTFVVFVAQSGGLSLIGLDAASGRTSWQHPTSAAFVTDGVEPTVAVAGGAVVDIERATTGATRVVGRDPDSGAVRWQTAPLAVTSWPEPCVDEPTVVCVTAVAGNDDAARLYRISAATGRIIGSVALGPDARELGPGLYDPGARRPDALLATAHGAILWRGPLAAIFDAPGATSDDGWDIDAAPHAGVYVGSVGEPPLSQTATTAVVDLSHVMTAGFRIGDGRAVWRDAGAQYACDTLPCAEPNSTNGSSLNGRVALRVRLHGTVHAARDRAPVVSGDTTAVIEGFDVATGRTRWSFDAGRNMGLVEQNTPPRVGATVVALPDRSGHLAALDVATGTTSALPAGAPAWCSHAVEYTVSATQSAAKRAEHRAGDDAVFSCDAAAHRRATPDQAPAFVGPSLDGVTAWSDLHAVHGAPTCAANGCTSAHAPGAPAPTATRPTATTTHGAGIGSAITLRDGHGVTLVVRPLGVVQHVSGTGGIIPASGYHFAAVRVSVTNRGATPYSLSTLGLSQSVHATDSRAKPAIWNLGAATSAGGELTALRLAPGTTATGYLSFTITNDAALRSLTWTLAPGRDGAATWTLG